ncbi:MAG: hypothetical protein ACPGJV_12355 [Bacteriovoracaceae bacterium]
MNQKTDPKKEEITIVENKETEVETDGNDKNIPLLKLSNRRGVTANHFSFRPLKSLSTSKSISRPKGAFPKPIMPSSKKQK